MTDLTFLGHRRPVLPAGDYEITVTQEISLDPETFPAARSFTVAAERFALPPDAITSLFPPAGGLGDYADILPHVILNRATLPWERLPGGAGVRPWLVLLVFSGDDQPEQKTVTLGTLTSGEAYIPVPATEKHDQPGDPVNVIDVPRELLRTLMPPAADLPYVAHVRRSAKSPDQAVVLSPTPPKPGLSTTVHLVSVEGRYTSAGFDFGGKPLVRLVTLASWRFASLDAAHSFAGLAAALADGGAPFRLPACGDPDADKMLAEGQVPVRHELRQGGRSISWYRGPFVTGPTELTPVRPVRTSDALLRFRPKTGMLETGYAAAWQLGRMLTLQHTSAATDLYAWKRRRAQAGKRPAATGHPLGIAPIDTGPPPSVLAFLRDLAELRGVPLRYLVPDERLLPNESIRFFHLDRQWIAHLLDGATSIGRLTETDADLDAAHPLPIDNPPLTGALIRSALVAAYPDLLIDAYPTTDLDAGTPITGLRPQRLGENLLLCLFTTSFKRLDLHQHPQSLHFTAPRRPASPVPLSTLASTPQALASTLLTTAERVTFLHA